MSNMKISTPLYEMDRPERVNDGDVWNSDGDRKYRLQSEGELFYVDTDLREDQVGSSRHDHDHHMGDLVGGLLGGVSLEDIRRSIEDRVVLGKGQQQEVVKPESLAETENASRSSSDSSADQCPQLHQEITTSVHSGTSDPINSSREVSTRVGYGFIDPPHRQQREEEQQRQTIQRDRKVQLDQISAFPEERGARERSFSEPHHLSRCTRATLAPHLLHSHCPPVSYAACPPSSIVTLRRRSSIAADEERFSSNGVHHRQQQRKKGEDFGKVLKKSLSCFGASKVEGVSRHLTSCTSTKTFEVLSGPAADGRGDQAILRRLGVLPDGWVGGGERGAITMTMHIAGHRVVSTVFGRHAEFEVRIQGGGRSWSRWQRFTKFKLIAQCVDKDAASMNAWRRVLRAQPHYRCLHEDYLALKCHLLELFLQQVMFAMPTPALLIHFVSDK